jgi:hypothetical protein
MEVIGADSYTAVSGATITVASDLFVNYYIFLKLPNRLVLIGQA